MNLLLPFISGKNQGSKSSYFKRQALIKSNDERMRRANRLLSANSASKHPLLVVEEGGHVRARNRAKPSITPPLPKIALATPPRSAMVSSLPPSLLILFWPSASGNSRGYHVCSVVVITIEPSQCVWPLLGYRPQDQTRK